MWEAFLGVTLEPWGLVRLVVPMVQLIFLPPPPCPPDGPFPQDMIRYGVSAARDWLWGQPCPP